MSARNTPTSIPPFPPNYRASGLLLHVTSLPSPYGIGDVGPSSLAWIDRLSRRGSIVVASAAAGPDGVWRLAVSSPVVVRRQRPSDQPGLADRGWTIEGQRLRGPRVPDHNRRL